MQDAPGVRVVSSQFYRRTEVHLRRVRTRVNKSELLIVML